MKFLFDLFPVFLFFLVFKWGEGHAVNAQSLVQQYLGGLISGGAVIAADQAPILLATAVTILASIGQITYLLVRRRKVDGMLWMSLAIITLLGSATIYFHSDTFIKWKPTVLYWCFAAGLLFSQLALRKNIIRSMLESQMVLPDAIWQRLNFAWAAFFSLMGVLNLVIAFNFPTATWVNFKVFGATGLMLAFVVAQTVILSKHIKDAP